MVISIGPSLRKTTYNPVTPTTAFQVNFPIFFNVDLLVKVNDVPTTDYTVAATYTADGVSTNAVVNMNAGVTGSVVIYGLRRPARTDQFQTGRPLPIENFNYALNRVEIENQEARRDIDQNTADIAQEIIDREDAVAAEAAARAAADSTLQSNINAEASTRLSADLAETAERLAGDNALGVRIGAEHDRNDFQDNEIRQLFNNIGGSVPLPAPYIIKMAGEFDVGDYIRVSDIASWQAVAAQDIGSQDGNKVLAAVRAAGDDALRYLQNGPINTMAAVMRFPVGHIGLKDELFSDAFQSDWWSQVRLAKLKMLTLAGSGDASTLVVRPDYVSSVRNTDNGNQRTYGAWANSASPSILLPALASSAPGAPSGMCVQNLRLRGTGIEGVDPIAWAVANELDAHSFNVHVQGFANTAEWINGSYNSLRCFNEMESNAAQPVEGGGIMGYPAGFHPSWVKFDTVPSGGNLQLTAKAGAAYAGYAVGDQVPFFRSSHVGKEFVIGLLAIHGGAGQALRTVVASVGGDGSATAIVTPPAGVQLNSGGTTLARAASFYPVKFSATAGSTTVNLSSPVKVGRGARDMKGQLVALPKAGSVKNSANDILITRVVGVSNGNDADGYSTVTIAEPPRNTVSGEDFVWTMAHAVAVDETLAKAVPMFDINDTGFVLCAWECSLGYGDGRRTSGYQMVVQDIQESTEYVSCKVHGGNPVQGMFAAEGQVLVDNSFGLQWSNIDFTHFGLRNKGAVRLMGGNGRVRGANVAMGGYQLVHDFCGVYVDPPSGYDPTAWGTNLENLDIKNTSFSTTFIGSKQSLYRAGSNISNAELIRLLSLRKPRETPGFAVTSADDLNNFLYDGRVSWSADVPLNAPSGGSNSFMEVKRQNSSRVYQIVYGPASAAIWHRSYNSGTWSSWSRIDIMPTGATADFAAATSAINTSGKVPGKLYRNTTTGAIYYPVGSAPTDGWRFFNSDGVVTPA